LLLCSPIARAFDPLHQLFLAMASGSRRVILSGQGHGVGVPDVSLNRGSKISLSER
jgi:hypothetical protein